MKILIYTANFAPEPTGIGKYSGEMASWLVKNGHEVHVVCAPPYYPAWKIFDGFRWPPYRKEKWEGVEVYRAPLWVPKRPGGTARVLHLLTFALSSMPLMLMHILWRPDIVVTVAPAFVCAPVGWMIAKLSKAISWLHIQDFEIDVAFQMNLLRGRRLQNFVLSMERWMLCRFDMVSSISMKMLDRLSVKGVALERVHFLRNWVDVEHILPLTKPSSYRTELGIAPDAVVVLFSGTLGNKQGLMIIPEAARVLADQRNIIFIVCGDGVMKPKLAEAASEMTNILLLPLQPYERLSELMGLADIHLLTQSLDAEDLVLPSKLTGMLASGRPIIATSREDTEIASVVKHCGVVVPPEDYQSLADAILKLSNEDKLRYELGKHARNYAEQNLGIDIVLNKFLVDVQIKTTTK